MSGAALFRLQVAGNVCRTYLGFNQISTMAYYNV
jgi:hypothetical protein